MPSSCPAGGAVLPRCNCYCQVVGFPSVVLFIGLFIVALVVGLSSGILGILGCLCLGCGRGYSLFLPSLGYLVWLFVDLYEGWFWWVAYWHPLVVVSG